MTRKNPKPRTPPTKTPPTKAPQTKAPQTRTSATSAPAPGSPPPKVGGTPPGRAEAAERFGRHAETWCRLALRLKGYRIVATRERNPAGEIDIVARRGAILAIVEVKARRQPTQAAEALTSRQRRRVARAAAIFLAQHPALATLSVRFDVMLVSPWHWPRHLRDAWRPD